MEPHLTLELERWYLSNLAPRIAKVAIYISRNNWIAQTAGGLAQVCSTVQDREFVVYFNKSPAPEDKGEVLIIPGTVASKGGGSSISATSPNGGSMESQSDISTRDGDFRNKGNGDANKKVKATTERTTTNSQAIQNKGTES